MMINMATFSCKKSSKSVITLIFSTVHKLAQMQCIASLVMICQEAFFSISDHTVNGVRVRVKQPRIIPIMTWSLNREEHSRLSYVSITTTTIDDDKTRTTADDPIVMLIMMLRFPGAFGCILASLRGGRQTQNCTLFFFTVICVFITIIVYLYIPKVYFLNTFDQTFHF